MIWSRISKLLLILILGSVVTPAQADPAPGEKTYNIAVLLPLTDKGKPFLERRSYQVLEGIKYAVHLFNKESTVKIGLIIRDTHSDSSEIASLKKEIPGYKNLCGIIGSTSSKDSRDVISVFSDMGLPIISPTATDEALPQLSDLVIQANPTFTTRGKIMASFARNFHGLSKIGIVYLKEGYSAQLAESFKGEFERLGGKVTLSLTYNMKDTRFESLIDEIQKADSKIEGIYFPVSDVKNAALLNERMRDLAFAKNVYGNQDWLLSDVFSDPAPFLSAMFIDSDYFLDMTQPDYQKMNQEFYDLTGYLFDRNALYGFDATSMFLKFLVKNNFSHQAFLNEVQTGIDYDGIKGKVVLDAKRTNLSLNILQYNFGKFSLFLKLKI